MEDIEEPVIEEKDINSFDEDLIRKYPRSNRRLSITVATYGLADGEEKPNSQSVHISPYGIEFRSAEDFPDGTLLKIHVTLPNYWNRKQKFVDYRRVDQPENFKILAKVLKSEDVGKRGKKKLVLAQTVIMDEVDEQVLKSYLQDG